MPLPHLHEMLILVCVNWLQVFSTSHRTACAVFTISQPPEGYLIFKGEECLFCEYLLQNDCSIKIPKSLTLKKYNENLISVFS